MSPNHVNSASLPLPESIPRISGKGKGKVGRLGGKSSGGKVTPSAIKKGVKEGVRKRPGMLALREIKKMQQ